MPDYSPNWMYDGVTTMFESKKGTSGKRRSKQIKDYMNPALCSSDLPSTFQTMMDTIFRDLILTNEVIVYMDDILIATTLDLQHHREITHQVLYRLKQHDLYLKPEKCSFETLEVEYLGVIIGYGQICMDPVKTQGVKTWEAPKNLTEARGFVGFLNFYRRFIKGFSKLARPLHDLTKKGVMWKWTPVEQNAFEALKAAVAEELVLLFPKLNEPFEMEVDASTIAIGAILNQKGEDHKTHPIAYYSESFSATERNYDVYNRELLAIVKSLRQWRTYLLGSPHKITIYTDHSNLQYWKELRKINRRVAREFQELSEYDFILKHIPGTSNTRADALSRRTDHNEGKEDNDDITVLPSNVFANATYTSLNEIDMICRQEQSKNQSEVVSWIDHHNLRQHDQLWWKGDALVVVGNNNLKQGVIQSFHDPPSMGHPGITNTHALIRRDYWWPNMKKEVEEYVKGCAACQANKINTHRIKPNLVLITTNTDAEPFEVIAMDFIVKLPKSQGYDMILTITDHDCSKAAIFIPCNETITAEGVVELMIKHVFPHYSFPHQVISDRDTHFMSLFMKHFYQKTGTKQNVSTAYHPQMDGQSERSNQWLEQYLHHICNLQQDNWADALPLAQFAHNAWPNTTTKETPFSLIMGWTPRVS